jgi:hypothetical protein
MIHRECPLEVNLGPGGLCGAVFVDEAFLDLLKRKFDNKKWVKMTAETRHHLLHDEWEHGIKPAFDGSEKTWKFNMPFECLDIKSLKAKAGPPKITLNTSEVRAGIPRLTSPPCLLSPTDWGRLFTDLNTRWR